MLASPGLLPEAMSQLVMGAAGAALPDRAASRDPPESAAAVKLGDTVLLGRSRRVRGAVRFIGPVLWDASGDTWVSCQLIALHLHACHLCSLCFRPCTSLPLHTNIPHVRHTCTGGYGVGQSKRDGWNTAWHHVRVMRTKLCVVPEAFPVCAVVNKSAGRECKPCCSVLRSATAGSAHARQQPGVTTHRGCLSCDFDEVSSVSEDRTRADK